MSSEESETEESDAASRSWDQSVTAFKAIISARICSAVWSHISDCDETFNYWEPMHFLLFGSGLQTWEYSPLYAIRSYAYLWFYSGPGLLLTTLCPTVRKTLVFVVTRIFLALICTLIEVRFHKAVVHRFGSFVGKITLAIQVFSIGMTIASISFLPSTFSMYCILLITASWLTDDLRTCIFANVLNVVIGWPFAGLAALPIVTQVAMQHRSEWRYLVKWSLIFVLAVAVSCSDYLAIH